MKKLLSKVWDLYKKCDANKLERLIHWEKSWFKQRLDLSETDMPNKKILESDMKENKPQTPKILQWSSG